jgi:hypothetical protein
LREIFQKEGNFSLEPFGLFQFLQSLLNTGEKKDENPVAPTPEKAEEIPTQTSQTPPQNTAITDFLSAHEQRARRIKK